MAASWMENVFIRILNQSISASWLILAVIVIRVCMKKTPKSLIECIFFNIMSIDQNITADRIIKAKKQLDQGCFTGAVVSNNSQLLIFINTEG